MVAVNFINDLKPNEHPTIFQQDVWIAIWLAWNSASAQGADGKRELTRLSKQEWRDQSDRRHPVIISAQRQGDTTAVPGETKTAPLPTSHLWRLVDINDRKMIHFGENNAFSDNQQLFGQKTPPQTFHNLANFPITSQRNYNSAATETISRNVTPSKIPDSNDFCK